MMNIHPSDPFWDDLEETALNLHKINMSKVEPEWVCIQCANERGAISPEGHIATFHEDTCGICGETKMVTEPRDYGRTRNLLKVKDNENNSN